MFDCDTLEWADVCSSWLMTTYNNNKPSSRLVSIWVSFVQKVEEPRDMGGVLCAADCDNSSSCQGCAKRFGNFRRRRVRPLVRRLTMP